MKKGFTLIELLIVIAVLAVLSAAVVLVLNPAELLKQSRDSTRISDLAAINSALALWTADVSGGNWYATTTCALGGASRPFAAGSACLNTTSTVVNGLGWVNVDLSAITGGSPLSRLPLDPLNSLTACGGTNTGCFYAYRSSSTVGKYKIAANMESTKYGSTGTADVESLSKDGGNIPDWYEIGSDMSL
ncbi:MAG: type II secretion system protein [Patescibacteria group bacterium]